MISAKEAVQIAKKELIDLNFDKELGDLALEGISHSEDRKINGKSFWIVILGYHQERHITSFLPNTLGVVGASGLRLIENRIYKTIHIESETGALLSIDSRFAELV